MLCLVRMKSNCHILLLFCFSLFLNGCGGGGGSGPADSGNPTTAPAPSEPVTDTVPDAFSFVMRADAPLSQQVMSGAVVIQGLDAPAEVSIVGGEYSIDGGVFSSAAGAIENNQTIRISLLSADVFSTSSSATLTIGGVSAEFVVTTLAADTTPDAFTFIDLSNAPLNTQLLSNEIIVAGLNTEAEISVLGGEYSVNSAAFTSLAATVSNGDRIIMRLVSAAGFSATTGVTLTIGGVSDTFSVTTLPEDTVPDVFAFSGRVGVDRSTQVYSDSITITGINSNAPVSISGGEYSVGGGAYTATAGWISNGQTVAVRQLSSSAFLTTTDAVLNVGGVSAAFSVTTLAEDIVPDTFSFADRTDVNLSTTTQSGTITVSGINSLAPISITGGEYSLDGAGFTSAAGVVANGQTVSVRQISSSGFLTTTDAVLNIGGVSAAFSVTTLAEDTAPDAFAFVDQADVELNTEIRSSTITVAGINSSAAISVSGGEYSLDGVSFTALAGTVNGGDTVTLRQTSSTSFSTTTDAVLTIGGVSDTFSVTTLAEDTTPDAFTFADQAGVELNTETRSNSITIAGINSAAAISVTSGEYSLDGVSFTALAGMVNNGDTVAVRQTSSTNFETATNAILTIGGVSDTFSVTTRSEDTTPDAFSFSSSNNLEPGSVEVSDVITVSGIDISAPIVVSGGEYSIDSGAYTSATSTVNLGQQVRVQQTASVGFSTQTDATLTIGGVSGVFSVTTRAADIVPDAFAFVDQTDVDLSTLIQSNAITVSGIEVGVGISVSGGEYAIGAGAFTALPGTVSNGQTVRVRVLSSANYSEASSAVLTIGGVSDSFSVTTSTRPPPSIISLNPRSVTEGVAGFTLTVDGGNFVSDSIVRWNGLDLLTTYVSPIRLQAIVPAAQIAAAGNISVTVFNPAPYNSESAVKNFIVAVSSPVSSQSVVTLSPNSIDVGSADTVVTISGSGFTADSLGQLDGQALATTFISTTQLQLVVPAAMLTAEARSAITVATPSVANPVSEPLLLFVLNTSDVLFYDDFNRADNTNLGNGWSEKAADVYSRDVFSISGGRVVATSSVPYAFNNNITYRPVAEDAQDVETSVEFIRTAAADPRYPQVHARIRRDDVAVADSLLSYTAFFYDEIPQGLVVTTVVNGGECYLAKYDLTEPLVVGDRYRIRYRIAGGNPVRMMMYLEHFDVDRWRLVMHGGALHDDTTGPVPGIWCWIGSMPAPNIYAGATGFAQYLDPTDDYESFYTVQLSNTDNPAPLAFGLTPTEVAAGSGALTLRVAGYDFFPGAVVRWNGVDLPTSYVSGAELEATVAATDLLTPTTASVTVFNPAPGGGESSALGFTITP